MGYKPIQRDIATIDFAPSKGYEVRRRRPALVTNKDSYNISINLVTVRSITSLSKKYPFLVPVYSEKLHTSGNAVGRASTLRVYSLNYTEQTQHRIKYVDTLGKETFYGITQEFLQNFSFAV